VTPRKVSLDPGQSKKVTVQIDVPADAAKGERYATVIAELPPPKSAAGSQVRVTSRVGVRIYLNIGSGGEPASDFTISTLTASRDADGVPTVSAQVTNTGGRALDLGGRLQLSDGPSGLRAGPFEVQVPRTLAIGQTGDVVVTLDAQTPAGPWLAKMTLRSGYVEHAVRGTILFPDAAGTSGDPVKAEPDTGGRNLLVPIGVLIGLGLLALLLFLLWRRRRRKDDEDQPLSSGPAPTLPAQRAVPEPERAAEPAPEPVHAAVREPAPEPVREPARKPTAARKTTPARKATATAPKTTPASKATPRKTTARKPAPAPTPEPVRDAGEDDAINRLRRR
jgi:LPXTG-motif cell wall-anchored protein